MKKEGFSHWIQNLAKSRETGLLAVLILIGGVFSLGTPTFLTGENLLNIVKQVTLVTIVAAGQTFVITSGGIDLSVGYLLGISSIVMALFISWGVPVPVAILICLLCGTMMGTINGLLITKLSLPPFIITLGMQGIARGLINVITQGYPIMVDSPFIMHLGQGNLGTVPVIALFMPVVIIITHWVYSRTVFGNHVKALGGNETAARLSGISLSKMKVSVYALCGLLCGLAGMLITGRLNSGNPNAGLNFDMDSIAAVIVGGTALSGGSGTVVGTMLGALLMGIIRNGLVQLRVNMYWQTVVTGAIIILVCALDNMAKTRRKGAKP